MNVPRRCSRPGCPHYAVATLTFVYADSTAVVTAPRGWDMVRHSAPLPINPDEDDLVALAEAVREGRLPSAPPMSGFSDPSGAAHAIAPTSPVPTGRRRGHLRVLPDPTD